MVNLTLRLFFLLLVINGFWTCAAHAQSDAEVFARAEYGAISELAGLSKVFIVASDLTTREIIVKELSKYPALESVSSREDAQFFIAFEIRDQYTGASIIGPTATANRTYYGNMIVFREGSESRTRILWHTQKRQAFSGGLTFSRHPAVNATREFLKAFRKAGSRSAKAETPTKLDPPFETYKTPAPVYSRVGMTLEGFKSLKPGMSYKSAVDILGLEGVETASTTTGNSTVTSYEWKTSAPSAFAVIIAMFENDRLINKAQSGLQ